MEEWVGQLHQYAASGARPVDGKTEVQGLESVVEIVTDSWGVPHVFAGSADDLLFAQGYLHATERLWQVDFTTRLARGRLAELLGELALPMDRFFRTIGLERAARASLDNVDDQTRASAAPYSRGFSEGARSLPKPVEYLFLDLEPSIPQSDDEALVSVFSMSLLMSFMLSPNWDLELVRLWLAEVVGPDRARQLAPFISPEPRAVMPGVIGALAKIAREAGIVAGRGSNNWVAAGSRTESGFPLLANDPHLKIQMPGIWMEMHLACPEYEVAGVSLPGVPGVVIGHNRRIAWGFTNTQADISDLYLEELSEDGGSYKFEGSWHPIEVIDEEISVRNSGTVLHQVRATRHGPLLTDTVAGGINVEVKPNSITDPLAFRWIQYEVPITQRSLEALARASNFEEFREAARHWPVAGQNMIYADVEGNIGYQFTGTLPVRAHGVMPGAPLCGWSGKDEWVGRIAFEDLPHSYNPVEGFIATANNRMVDQDYPHYLTNDWEPNYRIRRIHQLLRETPKHSIDTFKQIQSDTYSGIAEELLPFLRSIPSPDDPGVSRAFDTVMDWDLHLDRESTGAAVFTAWVSQIAERLFKDELGEELYDVYFANRGWTTLWGFEAIRNALTTGENEDLISEALAAANENLRAVMGENIDEWRWGSMHTVHFRHVLATAMPPLDDLLSAGPFPADGGDDTVNRGVFNSKEGFGDSAVSSYRQIIDLEDFDKSLSVITTGNSGNPGSPHYKDQSILWAEGKYHPMLFSREAIDAAAEGTLTLTPS